MAAMLMDRPPRNLMTGTAADRQAARNWVANLRTMVRTQCELVRRVEAITPRLAWTFGRDGSLTGRECDGAWLADCTLPRRAAEAMLSNLAVSGRCACLLDPPHAAYVQVVLERMQPQQCLIVVAPDKRRLRAMLSCADFSMDVARGRLWFCGGRDWPQQLRDLLDRHAGIAAPQQFIRLPMQDEATLLDLAGPAEAGILEINTARARRLAADAAKERAPDVDATTRGICCIAGSLFRLWDDAPREMERAAGALSEHPVVKFDPDSPLCATPLALRETAAGCRAVLSADIGRADAPGAVGDDMTWITWAVGRVPDFAAAGPRDWLLAVDRQTRAAAERAGWPADRILWAAWPAVAEVAATELPARDDGRLALICDTVDLSVPEELEHYSSHRLLWETIRQELLENPFVMTDAEAFLLQRMRRHGVSESGLDRAAFLGRLVLPAYQQGIARALIQAGLPLRLHGRGWASLAGFSQYAEGAVEDRAALEQIVRRCRGLVCPWPHIPPPLRALARPVLCATGGRAEFLRRAEAIITRTGTPPPPAEALPSLNTALRGLLV